MRKLFLVAVILITNFFFLFSFISSVYAQGYPDESEVNCWRIEKQCVEGKDSSAEDKCGYDRPPDYTKASGETIPELRPDAGLNFNTAVKGAYCGEVKSSPIVLQEKVSYPGPPWDACTINPAWGGEIQMNYNFTEDPSINLRIPFAQEIADQWAGTLDTEHMKPEDYDKLISTAYPDFGNLNAVNSPSQLVRNALTAQNEINLKAGVLRKLLPMDQQDELKCDFANWVAKRHNRGIPTMYTYYAPDGKVFLPLLGGPACRNVVCPLIKTGDSNYDRAKCLSDYDDGTYKAVGPYGEYAPGPAWQKMGLIPNERTRGQIKYFVCADKMYDQRPDYPEVMRLGLSANELFKIFTDKSSQDRFYSQYPDLKGNPLENLLPPPPVSQNSTDSVVTETPLRPASVETSAGKQDYGGQAVNNEPAKKPSQNISILVKTSNFLKIFIPKVQTVLAKTVDNIKTNKTSISLVAMIKNKDQTLLAQATCTPLEAVYEVIPGDKFNYKIIIRRTDCGKQKLPGPLGHVRLYLDYPDSPAPQDSYMGGCNQDKTACGQLGFTPEMIPWLPKINSEDELKKWLASGVLKYRADAFNIAPTSVGSVAVAVSPGTNLAGKCDSSVSCCVTAECGPATCATCVRTQVGPSQTTVWPQGYPASHSFLGVDWGKDTSAEIFNDPVEYRFKPTLADCTFTPSQDADGLFTNCQGDDDNSCGGELSCNGGKCGSWSCSRTHDRVVNVYNSVPFLASAWKQSADPVWGFMSAIKPLGIIGSGNIPTDFVGCSDDEKMIFDQRGNYVPQHGAAPMYYGFRQMFAQPNNADNIEVSMKEGGEGKVLYYRLAGTCNANKWWTEKVLNTYQKGSEILQGK